MDFQFTPESEHNPEESLSGIVHTPGVTDFSSPHTLGEGAPLKPGIEGGALEGMGGPAKPTLHVGEPKVISNFPQTTEAATPEGGSVSYHYGKFGQPVSATKFNANGGFESTHEPEDINFPPHPLAQPAPTKPVLHVGETVPVSGTSFTSSGKTTDGGTVLYDYNNDGSPGIASVYDATGNWKATHYPDSIAFPPAPKAEVDPYKQVPWKAEKPTLHVGALKSDQDFTLHGEAVGGGHVYYDYDSKLQPKKAEVFNENGNFKKEYKPNEIDFPPHPDATGSVSLPKLSLGPKYEEEPIEELYKPREDSSYPKAQLSAPLSRDEINSIKEYTGSYYSDINHYVRNKSNLDEGDFVRNEKHEDHMANLDSAIAKASLPEPVTLYRGISGTLFSKFASRLEPGETILHQNYMSTSSRHEFAQAWKSGHTMILETPAGTHALPVEEHSQNSGEKEIIFPRDTRLKLVKKDSKSLYFEVIP